MSKRLFAGMLVFGIVACSPASAKNEAPRTAGAVSNRPAQRTLASGTSITASIQDSLSSRHNKAGETLRATVNADVRDPSGQVAIPAGSAVGLRVAQLEAAPNKSRAEANLALGVPSVTARGKTYQVTPTGSLPSA